MSEKAVSIGNYVVATGLDTFLGVDPYVKGSSEICDLLTGEHGVKDWVEANYTVETDIEKLGDLMIERIEAKRAALGAGHLSMNAAASRSPARAASAKRRSPPDAKTRFCMRLYRPTRPPVFPRAGRGGGRRRRRTPTWALRLA